jgi:crotonobetainyl-CoA:carnitine CoA-transferase CaiB-like acyl-CoA transferase
MNAQTIDIATLTPEQLAAITKQLRDSKRAKSGDPKKRNPIVDKLLQEKDGTEFKHTTADILAALQAANVVAATLTPEERAAELKKVQTRKQLLVKKPENKGKYGYKQSANGFSVTLARVLEWLKTASPQDRKTVNTSSK